MLKRLLPIVFMGLLVIASSGCINANRAATPKFLLKPESAKQLTQRLTEVQRGPTVEGRNGLIMEYVRAIDYNYVKIENNLYVAGATFTLSADTVVTTLTSLATFVNPARTKSVLSGAATGVTAFRSSAEKNFLQQQSTITLINQMRASRERRLKKILDNMTRPLAQYSIAQAMSEVFAYYEDGTIVSALAAMAQQSGQEASQAHRQLLGEEEKK